MRSPFTSTPLAAGCCCHFLRPFERRSSLSSWCALASYPHMCVSFEMIFTFIPRQKSAWLGLRFQFCHFLRTHNDDDDTKGGSSSARTSTCAVKIHKVQRCTVYTHEEGKIYMRRKSSPLSKGGKSEQEEEEEESERGGEKRSFCISHTAAAAVAVSASAAEKISSTFPFPPTNDDADDPSHLLDLSHPTSSSREPPTKSPYSTHSCSLLREDVKEE